MMHTKRMSLLRNVGLVLAAVFFFVSCEKPRQETDGYGKVMILYSAGFNNLSADLAQNIIDLEKGFVPDAKSRDVIAVVSRRTVRNQNNYTDETAPCLFRIYKRQNTVVRDTLFSMPAGTPLSGPDAMRRFLTKIRELFPAESYGMIFASHSTGWLPQGYYSNPSAYDRQSTRREARTALPGIALFPDGPEAGTLLTRSAGADYYKQAGNSATFSHEMDITDMASAIPMHLDYLIFDSCLMGGVEVAYELKDVADKIGFSQAEVLSAGMNYRTATEHLLRGIPDPAAVCRDYFDQYDRQSGIYRSATTAIVNCRRLPELAAVCKPLFEKYGSDIRKLGKDDVQGFGGARKPWFFDLRDILEKAGAQEPELTALDTALDDCLPYKAHTGQYYSMYASNAGAGVVPIHTFCGLSMYLPGAGSAYLDNFYKTLAWNRDSGLVR